MAKILQICKSEDLPILSNRDSNYVYFVYDKMAIYIGKNYYSDPFCIVDDIPEDAVEGMLYITMNGDMKTIVNYTIIDIGAIEEEGQKELLKQAGTVYFMKAESRYLDLQTRTIQLPYQNGSFLLTVSLSKDIMIDEDTVIRYEPESGKFIIDGNPWVDETGGLPGLEEYKGSESSTIKTVVSNNNINAALKISSRKNNILKVYGNGLYASVKDFVSDKDLNTLISTYANYKAIIDSYIEELRKELESAGINVSEESVNNKILSALEGYEPTIQTLLENYDIIYQQLGMLRESVTEYTENYLAEAKKEILNYIRSIDKSWSIFPGDGDSYESNTLTPEELSLQALALAEFRKNILYLRDVEGTHSVSLDYFFITDDTQFDNIYDIRVLPKLLTVTTDMSSLIGFSYITVTPTIEEGNKYLWKVTNDIPAYFEDLTLRDFKFWDGISEIKVENNAHVILVEVDQNNRAIKYGEFVAESRIENPKELQIIDVISSEGEKMGHTELIINPPIESGNIYMLKKATTIPEYNTILSSDYIYWDGISEIKMDLYDMEMVCLVECTEDFHRARKVGLFPIDLTNELLKKLRFTTVNGTNLYYTKVISISPTLSAGNTYRIKITNDNILPKLNTYVNDWDLWNGKDEIRCNLGSNLIITEVDPNIKVKKVGIVAPNINNLITNISVSYDEYEAGINRIIISDQVQTNIYYYTFNSDEEVDIVPLPYGTFIDINKYSILTSSGIPINKTDNKISIVEESNGLVYRSCIVNTVITYADKLTITSTKGTNAKFTTLSVTPTLSTGNKYLLKVLIMDDGISYLKNELIDPIEFIAWDGMSEVDLSTYTGDSIFINVLECNSNNRVLGFGTVIPVYDI